MDSRLSAAASAALELGVSLNVRTDTEGKAAVKTLSGLLDRRTRSACSHPSRVHFEGGDTGPNGVRNPLQLAQWVVQRAPTHPGVPRLDGAGTRIAVVARPGRFMEGVPTGSVAVLIAGLRCT